MTIQCDNEGHLTCPTCGTTLQSEPAGMRDTVSLSPSGATPIAYFACACGRKFFTYNGYVFPYEAHTEGIGS